jgi:hypothetical protein
MHQDAHRRFLAAHAFCDCTIERRKWDHFSRIGGATFSAGAGGSAG